MPVCWYQDGGLAIHFIPLNADTCLKVAQLSTLPVPTRETTGLKAQREAVTWPRRLLSRAGWARLVCSTRQSIHKTTCAWVRLIWLRCVNPSSPRASPAVTNTPSQNRALQGPQLQWRLWIRSTNTPSSEQSPAPPAAMVTVDTEHQAFQTGAGWWLVTSGSVATPADGPDDSPSTHSPLRSGWKTSRHTGHPAPSFLTRKPASSAGTPSCPLNLWELSKPSEPLANPPSLLHH